MITRRLAYIGAIVGLVLALAVSFQAVSASPVRRITHRQPSIAVTVRISQARAYRRPRSREEITVVVVFRGTGLRPRARYTVQNNVIVIVNGRQRAAVVKADDTLEAENDATVTVQTDANGALSASIPADMNGTGEAAGTSNTLDETASVSDSTGQQVAITDTTATVASN